MLGRPRRLVAAYEPESRRAQSVHGPLLARPELVMPLGRRGASNPCTGEMMNALVPADGVITSPTVGSGHSASESELGPEFLDRIARRHGLAVGRQSSAASRGQRHVGIPAWPKGPSEGTFLAGRTGVPKRLRAHLLCAHAKRWGIIEI